MSATAVVFAYHDVGVRCLSVLLAHKVDVRLVVTHVDDPRENIWFGSVAGLAALHDIPCIAPEDPPKSDLQQRLAQLAPDFIFSFYYRHMLPADLLESARRGAYNMHGSLLPRYRGRVPVNWALVHGECETGATLHEMVAKPDAGGIVDQQAVPILPNDIAIDVFRKVTVAAEITLDRALPGLLAGTARVSPQNLAAGSYFGGRRPEHGRIDWEQNAWAVHNLVRAVAPPYPGAFSDLAQGHLRVLRTHYTGRRDAMADRPALYRDGERLMLRCADGGMLTVVSAEFNGKSLTAANLQALTGQTELYLDSR